MASKKITKLNFSNVEVISKPDIQPINIIDFISIKLIANRLIQRGYGHDNELFIQILGSVSFTSEFILEEINKIKDSEDKKEIVFIGDNLGLVGVKYNVEDKTEGNVPEGQHRKVKLNLFNLALLHEAKESKDKETEKSLTAALFMNSKMRVNNFSLGISNDSFNDEENLYLAIDLFIKYIKSSLKISYEVFLKGLSKENDCYKNVLKNEYNKTLIASQEYIKEEKENLKETINPIDYSKYIFMGMKHTWIILNSVENEAKAYGNSFHYSKKQEENDRVRVNCQLSSTIETIDIVNKLIVNIEKKSLELFAKDSKKMLTAVYRSQLMESLHTTKEKIEFITMNAGHRKSVAFLLGKALEKGELEAISFLNSTMNKLSLIENLLIDIENKKGSDLILGNLFKNVDKAVYRIMPLILVLTKLIQEKETNFNNIFEINTFFNLMANYVFTRKMVLKNNTEKKADKFFAKLTFEVRNSLSIKEFNYTVESFMRKEKMLVSKQDFNDALLIRSKVTDHDRTLFKTLIVFANKFNNLYIYKDLMESVIIDTHKFISKANYNNEHMVSDSLSLILSNVNKDEAIAIEKYLDSVKEGIINIHGATDMFNREISNNTLEVKFARILDFPNQVDSFYYDIAKRNVSRRFFHLTDFVSFFENEFDSLKNTLMNFLVFSDQELSDSKMKIK